MREEIEQPEKRSVILDAHNVDYIRKYKPLAANPKFCQSEWL